MFYEDYIMRIIRKAVYAIAKVLELYNEENYELADEALDNTCRELTGMSIDLLNSLSYIQIIEFLSMDKEPDAAKCIAAAQILKAHALMLEKKDEKGKAFLSYQRSFMILENIKEAVKDENTGEYDMEKEIKKLSNALKDYDDNMNL